MSNYIRKAFRNVKLPNDDPEHCKETEPVVELTWADVEDSIAYAVDFMRLDHLETDEGWLDPNGREVIPDIDKLVCEFMTPDNLDMLHKSYREWLHNNIHVFLEAREKELSTKYNTNYREAKKEDVSS